MTWLSINPNSLTDEVKAVCAQLLEYKPADVAAEPLRPTELAEAFNLLDPEVCNVSPTDRDLNLESAEL